MRTRATTRYAVGLAMAATLAVAGCTGDPKDPGTPTSTAPGTSTGTTSSTPPTTSTTSTPPKTTTTSPAVDPDIPAIARAHTPAGAASFVHYFFDQLNVAWTRPQAGLLPPLCRPTSKSCESDEKTAVDLVSKGQHYEGNPVTTTGVNPIASDPNTQAIQYVGVQERRNVIDANGKVVLTDSRKDVRFEVTLDWTPSGWLISTIKNDK